MNELSHSQSRGTVSIWGMCIPPSFDRRLLGIICETCTDRETGAALPSCSIPTWLLEHLPGACLPRCVHPSLAWGHLLTSQRRATLQVANPPQHDWLHIKSIISLPFPNALLKHSPILHLSSGRFLNCFKTKLKGWIVSPNESALADMATCTSLCYRKVLDPFGCPGKLLFAWCLPGTESS